MFVPGMLFGCLRESVWILDTDCVHARNLVARVHAGTYGNVATDSKQSHKPSTPHLRVGLQHVCCSRDWPSGLSTSTPGGKSGPMLSQRETTCSGEDSHQGDAQSPQIAAGHAAPFVAVPDAATGKAGGKQGLAELWTRLRGRERAAPNSRQLATMTSFDLDGVGAGGVGWAQRDGQHDAVTATHKVEVRCIPHLRSVCRHKLCAW